jgi:hypothetical protein
MPTTKFYAAYTSSNTPPPYNTILWSVYAFDDQSERNRFVTAVQSAEGETHCKAVTPDTAHAITGDYPYTLDTLVNFDGAKLTPCAAGSNYWSN